MLVVVLEYLIVPGQAVEAQSTASGISTLQIQTVQVKTAQHLGGVVHNPCTKMQLEIQVKENRLLVQRMRGLIFTGLSKYHESWASSLPRQRQNLALISLLLQNH